MPLTRQNKQVIDIIESEPHTSQTEAYQRVYGVKNRKNANERASKLMAKPEAQVYRQEHVNRATNRVAELVESEREEIALRASQDILDRHHGKATQKQETVNKKVTISIDLSDDAPKISQAEEKLLDEASEL